jgi:hypothetical protein
MRQGNTSTIEVPFWWSGCGRVVLGADNNAKRLVLQCINGVSSNPVKRRIQIWQLKNIILTLFGLIFGRIYIIFSIYLVSQVTLISSGTDIVWGCHLLICSYNILYFLWLYNELFIILYNILRNCCARLLSNYKIKYACTIYIRLDTCLMSISVSSLRDKVTLRRLKLHFYGANVVEWSRALGISLSDWCCSVSMVWAQIPSREQNLIAQKIIC